MIKVAKKLFNNRLFYNTFVMLAGGTIMNAGNYLYHLLMGRFLGPSEYGALASLIAILYLIGIPSGTLNLVVAKMTAQFKGKNEYGKVSRLFSVLNKWIMAISIFIVLIFFLSNSIIASFLKINEVNSITALGVIFALFFLIALNRSIIQGLQKFEFLSVSNIIEMICKLGFGLLAVKLGFGVTGAILAMVLTEFLIYLITVWPLKFSWLTEPVALKIEKTIFLRNLWAPLTIFLALTSLFSIDIILVKHFLPEYEAGLYAALAVMGKVIFLASSAVVLVMYPMIAEAHAKKENYKYLFGYSFIFISIASIVLTSAYYLYPKVWIGLFFGSDYESIAPYLGPFAVFISLYSLINLFVNFFFAITKIIFIPLLILAAASQVIFISIFHQSIYQIITVSIIVSALLLFSLILIFIKEIAEMRYNSKKCDTQKS